MVLTVAVCTYNRSALLRQALDAFRAMDVPSGLQWELVVVDNNSTDDTPSVLASAHEALPLRTVAEKRQGIAHARNRAVDEARGDSILWTDDDVIVGGNWLRAFYTATVRHPTAAVFGGPIEPWFPSPPDPMLTEAFPMLATGYCGLDHDLPEGLLDAGKDVWGANMGFRLSILRKYRFPTEIGSIGSQIAVGEETAVIEQIRRDGGPCVWVPGMRVRHFVAPDRMTLSYLCRYTRGRGRTWVRAQGCPGGKQLYGVPLWMVKQLLVLRVRSLLRRPGCLRSGGLAALRKYDFFLGAAVECLGARRKAAEAAE